MTTGNSNNAAAFESADRVGTYSANAGLTAAEMLLVKRWVPPGVAVLDLGVGTGQYHQGVNRGLASGYVGVDYSRAMVTRAREQFPTVTFVEAEARGILPSSGRDHSFERRHALPHERP